MSNVRQRQETAGGAWRILTDGGARGNPGPAAAGVIIQDEQGVTLFEGGFYLGRATNNVAEYRGMIEGLKEAARLGARRVEVVSDSQLMVRQMLGEYRVKNAGLAPLYQEARRLAEGFEEVRFSHTPREGNQEADRMVNQALDQARNCGDAASRRIRPAGTAT